MNRNTRSQVNRQPAIPIIPLPPPEEPAEVENDVADVADDQSEASEPQVAEPVAPAAQPAEPADAAAPPDAAPGLDPQMVQFAQLIAHAVGMAVTQAHQTAPPDAPQYPKAKDPSMFNGRNRKSLRTWIGENEICFRTAPNLYRTDISKVMFAGSFLEGDAKTWFTDYFKDPDNTPVFMEHWGLFIGELQRNFGLEDEIGAAEEELQKLVMSDRDHATYFTAKFRAIVANLQGSWNDRTLRNQYYKKLAPRLRSQLVSAGIPVPDTLEPLISVSERFDRAYWANYELDCSLGNVVASLPGRAKTSSVQTAKTSVPNTPPAKNTSQPGTNKAKPTLPLNDQGKLTGAEKQRRMELGACLYCGETGHFAKECKKKTSGRSSAPGGTKPSARATITVEDEESEGVAEESGKE